MGDPQSAKGKGRRKVRALEVVAVIGAIATPATGIAVAMINKDAAVGVATISREPTASVAVAVVEAGPSPLVCTSPWSPWRSTDQCSIGPVGHCTTLLRPDEQFRLHLSTIVVEGAANSCEAAGDLWICVKSEAEASCLSQAEACRHASTVSGPWTDRGVSVSGRDLSGGIAIEVRGGGDIVVSRSRGYASGLEEIALCEGGRFGFDPNPRNVKSFTYYLERISP